VIVLTCWSNPSDNVRAFELSVREYIVKPLDLASLHNNHAGKRISGTLDRQRDKTWHTASAQHQPAPATANRPSRVLIICGLPTDLGAVPTAGPTRASLHGILAPMSALVGWMEGVMELLKNGRRLASLGLASCRSSDADLSSNQAIWSRGSFVLLALHRL
jgi:hypothetical protein